MKANPQGVSLNNRGEVLYAYKVNVNNNAIGKAAVGVMRKSSNTQTVDQFHLASSMLHQFSTVHNTESIGFIGLAQNYVLSGRSLSEMCDHNSAVAKEYGNLQVCWVYLYGNIRHLDIKQHIRNRHRD